MQNIDDITADVYLHRATICGIVRMSNLDALDNPTDFSCTSSLPIAFKAAFALLLIQSIHIREYGNTRRLDCSRILYRHSRWLAAAVSTIPSSP